MADQPSGGLNAPAVSGTAMATTPPVAQGTNAGVIPPDSAASKASSGSHDIVEADTVEKAMGDLLDQVQGQTNFPVSPPGTKLSSTLTYDVAAWLSVKVHGKWILFDGFELTDIGLKVALSKSTGSNASMSVLLEATILLDNTPLKISGQIPRLEDGEDTDFVLTIATWAALDSIPLDSLLVTSSSKDIQLDSVRGAIDPKIASQLFTDRPAGFAASASLTITRLAKNKRYQVRSFDASIMGDIDWDVMPGQLQIRSAGLSVLAQRKKPTDKLDWTLGIAGSLLVAGSTPVNLKGQLIIQKGKCTGLEARVEVGPYQGVLLSSLMDAAAGADASKKAQEDYAAPPKLFIPVDNPSRPLVLAVALSNSASGWSLTKAEASLALDDFGWSPIDGLSIQSLLFTLKAQRGLPLSPPSTNPGQLVYAAYLRGVLDLAGLPLIAEVAYDSKKSVLTVRATAAENAVCSLQKLCGALSDKIAAIPGADINPTYDLKPVTDVERVPQGCPVDTDWVLHGNYGSQRQCLLLFEDSKLTRLNLSVIYQNPASNWKLSDGLQMVNLGIFFDASFETPASISDPSIAAFVYGTLSLSQGTIIFGFVGCSKTPDRKEFDVLLTVHHQPNKGLGKPPQDVMSDQSLVGQAIDITGLTLPSSVPADKLKLEDSVTSVDAAVRASFVSVEKEAPTVLISVAASLRVTGVLWKMLDNLELTDLAVGVKAVRKDTAPASPFQILGSIYGRAQVTVGTSNFDLWAHAVLDKKDSASEFLASITTCTAGMAKEPPVSSSLSPAQLTQLAPLGDFKLTVPAEQQPPADCPVQVETLINSVAARCEVRVTKTSSGSSEGDAWAVSKLTFSLAASGSWVVLPAKLTLNIASLTVAVTDPGIAVNRRVTAMLAARMMVGTSTALDALLTFSRAQSKTVISGTLAATSSTAINVVQMAGELVPGGQPGPSTIIPDKSTNLDIFPTAQIRFWLDANQPTMLIAGATNSGHLLYFLHRPDPQTDVYFWLLSLSIGNVTQVFPWIDASVTGAFALQDIGVEMINATLPVKTLVSYLVLAEGGGGDHESMHPQGGMGPQPQKSSPLVLLRNLDQTAELVAGAWIFATVNLQGGGTMTDALTLAVLPDSKPQITLYTNVHADTKNMDCCLQFSNFTFFGDSLVVNGVLVYSPSKNSIQGSATLTLKGLTSQGTPQLTAAFTMTSTETTILGRLAVEKQVNIDNPFDGMYNTSLAVTKVKAKLVKATQGGQPPTSAVTVRGSLRLGPPDSAWTARARAIFVNGQVRVVVGTMGDISTVEVVDELLEPGQPAPAEGAQQSGSWPINFPTFNFQSASIYYAKSVKPHEDSLVIDGITYQFGYCIAAKLSLFGHLFTITAYLPENRSGLKIQGTYDQVIDLSFAKLYGYTFGDKDLPWPTLEINTSNNQQVYTATAGIEVFGIKGYKIALSYKSEIKRLTGTIDYSGTILGVLDPIITLAYEDGHLYIDAWPFKKDGEEKDKNFLQKAIREGSKVVGCDKCGDLVELVLDKLIRTAFDFSLGKPRTGTDPMAGQNYVGSLKWSYVVYVTVPGVGEKEIARLNMDDVDLTIDKGFSADSIGEALLALLAQQVVNVGKALLHDPAKFAALIALMNMKGAAAKVLNGLLCRRVDEENVKEEAEKTVNERQGEPDETAGATEAAFTAVVSATSFVAAAVTFGEGVLAFAGFLGLGILFGPSASLASHLLPLLDPSKRDPIQAMIKAYGDHQTACQAAQNEAKVHLRDIARLSAVPAARWTTDTPTEAALSVDWSAALPKPPANVPADYFGDFKTFTWQLAYSTDSDPNAAKGVTVLPAAVHDDKTWGPVADPMFLTQRSVYIWVRANFTLNGETVLADWSPTGSPLTHPLWHPTPAGLVVSTGNAPAYDHVAVAITAPGAAPTRYQVAFAADEQTAATAPAYQKESADGSGCFTTPVLDLTLEPKDVGLLKGFVRQLSADKTQFHDSPWTASDGGLQIMQEDLVVTIEQAGFECLLEWNGSGTAAAAFAYVVTQRDGSVIIPLKAIEEPASVTSRIRMRLGSPEFKDGAAINFAVRRIPAGPNILQVFTRQSFTFQAMISITADSFFDAEAQNLELYVNSITPLSVGQVATVTLYSASSSQPYTAEIEFFDNTKMLGKVTSVPVKSPFLLKVDVTVQPNPQQAVLKSSQWDFPDQIDAPSASDFHTYFDTSLTAYWAVSSTAAAASCRMDLVSNDLSPLVKGKDLPAGDFAGGKYTVALFGTDLDGLQGNKKAKIQIWCTSAKGRTFKSKEKTCWLPDLTQWTAPERAANPANVAPRSSLTAMSAPLVDATGAVWWLNSNSSAVKGAARTPPDTWAAFTAATAKTAPLAGGSCVASCSRAANHLEVFWIDRWGGIQGAWRLRSRKFQQPTDYKTQGRGTATTARGGSLVAASCARGTMDIWFVAPDGRVRSSHFDNHSGWGELTTVANAGAADASNTALSSLALCTRADGSGAVELFWIQGQTLQNRRCRDTRAGDAYDAQAVVPAAGADPPAPGSTPCAVDAGNRGTFVAWITASGAVRAAVRQADSGGPLPAWTAAWTVAPAHAASPRSRICSGVAVSAFSGGAGRPAALGNLYWVGEDGRVTIAEFASEASPARLSLEYWAAYKHMVNIGWRTGVDSRAEIVAEDLDRAGAVRLFWVGGDSYVSTMRWPKLL